MTLNELIHRLEIAAEEVGGDAEVRLAYQPTWPLQSHVAGVATSRDLFDEQDDEWPEYDPDDLDHGLDPADDAGPVYVWIVDAGQVYDTPYAPRAVFDAAR